MFSTNTPTSASSNPCRFLPVRQGLKLIRDLEQHGTQPWTPFPNSTIAFFADIPTLVSSDHCFLPVRRYLKRIFELEPHARQHRTTTLKSTLAVLTNTHMSASCNNCRLLAVRQGREMIRDLEQHTR